MDRDVLQECSSLLVDTNGRVLLDLQLEEPLHYIFIRVPLKEQSLPPVPVETPRES